MNPDTTPTPQYDSVQNWAEAKDLCREFERELTEKANEVARLRELLNRAIAYLKKYESPADLEEAKMLSDQLNKLTK